MDIVFRNFINIFKKVKKLLNYFEKNKNVKRPKALIAKTIKGKGFSFSENNNDWHHAPLSTSQYEIAINELNL